MGIEAVSNSQVKANLETIRRRRPQQVILRLARRARWGRRGWRRCEITDMIHTGARVVDGDAIQAGQQEVCALRQRLALHTVKKMKHDPAVPWLDHGQTRGAEDSQESGHCEEHMMVRYSHTPRLRYEQCGSHRSPTLPWLGRRQIDQDE